AGTGRLSDDSGTSYRGGQQARSSSATDYRGSRAVGRGNAVRHRGAPDLLAPNRTETRARMRILVLSDIHANLPAFEAVLDSAPDHDAIGSLGDTVGYGASPNEWLDPLVVVGAQPALVGNHDLAAVGL